MSSEPGSPDQKASGEGAKKTVSRKGQDVNLALRRAYESALDESIPKSMLDLLAKLS